MADKTLKRLTRIDYFIQHKATGKPKVFAEKLSVSERTLYGLLAIMKQQGAPIKYCRFKETYFYDTSGSFKIKFTTD